LALGNADEAIAVEHRIYSVDGWCLDVVVQTAQLLANLRCTPARVLGP